MSYTPKFFYPVLPKLSVISGAHCKIWHTNPAIHCKRCNSDEHRTVDLNKCEAYDAHPSTAVFKFDEDPRSNFFLCKNKSKVFNREWPTSEHSYQWVKLMENGQTELVEQVLTAPIARAAKMVSIRAERCPSWIRKHSPGRGYHGSLLGSRNATLPGNLH